VNSQVLFQMYWSGDRDTMLARLARARDAGAKGSSSRSIVVRQRARLGQSVDPGQDRLKAVVKLAPEVATRPRWFWSFARTGHMPGC